MHLTRSRTMVRVAAIAAALLLVAGQAFATGVAEPSAPAPTARAAPANPRVRLATTTSTENSGLLSFMLPEFTKDTGYTVDVVAVGTGAALKLGENADADILLVHARSLEDAFMAAGHGTERRDVMYNDFVILGPKTDPAGIKNAPNAIEAFKRMASTSAGGTAAFVSRGDNSGTHVMEKNLWKAAGITPDGSWYKEAGQGMEQVIIMTDGLAGYTLTDRGTWLAVKDKTNLAIAYDGDPTLFNPYGVITVNPAKHADINAQGAKVLLDWFTSTRGQELVSAFKLGGETLFFPNYKP
jgi:tungstate transport system substrate-binding protein